MKPQLECWTQDQVWWFTKCAVTGKWMWPSQVCYSIKITVSRRIWGGQIYFVLNKTYISEGGYAFEQLAGRAE